MKYIKSFNESKRSKTKEEIEEILGDIGVSNYTINPDGKVDVNGDVNIHVLEGKKLPIKFGKVTGDFWMTEAYELTSLEGCPDEVGGSFTIEDCGEIKSIKGCPKTVGLNFEVTNCLIKSLEGCPEVVPGYFDCSETLLTSLKGGPKYVGEDYYANQTRITDLEGGPEEVGFNFYLQETNLTTLKGLPKRSKTISISTRDCKLWDPREFKNIDCEEIRIDNEPIGFLMRLFSTTDYRNLFVDPQILRTQDRVTYEIFIDSLDYNYIRGTDENPQIDLFRFKEALAEFDIIPRKNLFNNWCLPYYQFIDEDGNTVNFLGERI